MIEVSTFNASNISYNYGGVTYYLEYSNSYYKFAEQTNIKPLPKILTDKLYNYLYTNYPEYILESTNTTQELFLDLDQIPF